MSKFRKLGYIMLGFIVALTNCIGIFNLSVFAAAVTPEDGNIYYIKNKNSGLYLQVEGDSAKDGVNVCQATGTGSTGQKWIINDNGDGTVRIKSALDLTGGLALDIPNGVADNSTNVQIWSSNGLAPQNYKLVDNGSGYYAICTQVSDFARCLDVVSWSSESGANVMQYDCLMGDNQLWAFENASWPSSSTTTTTTTEKATTTTTEKATEATTKASSSDTKSWNMSNSSFKGLGTISSTKTVDGLNLIATSDKTMEVKAASATVDSNSFSYCLALGGSGSKTYRAVSTNISGTSTIKVTAQSSGSSARTLNVVASDGTVLGTISAGTSAAVGSIKTTYSGTVYIYSAGSGINIYKVQVDTTGGSSDTTTTQKATTTTTTTEKATETTTKAATSNTKSWNMGNSSFKGLGTISSSKTIDGLKLIATSDKTMEVRAASATVDSNSYSYCLALGGSGSKTYRAVAMDINGTSTIKVTAQSSGSSARTLNVVKSDGTVLGTIPAGTSAATGSVKTTYSGTVYIYSAGSGINIYKVQLDTTGTVPGGNSSTETTEKATTATTEKATETTTIDTSGNSVTVSDFSGLVNAVKSMASKSGGGTVYVNAKNISCTAQLALNSTKGNAVKIVGVKQSDGTYPVLDFSSFRNISIGNKGGSLSASGDSDVGVRITGSKYTLQNLIIEKAGDNGIQIKGSNANNNTVYNCIVRYNNDAGVQITGGASNNAMKFVYSYRNCDIYTRGGNSDGFAPKLGATTGNTFYGCYAWDNSDDGWDSFDKTDSGYTKDLSYEECACWNNGNPDVFTGKYDYDNGNSLDTNLFLVEVITKQDSNFASNYKNGKFSLPTASFIKTDKGTINLSSWIGSNYGGNPNGFKFGSVNSGSSLTRTVKNCLAFGHDSKGFDNNNSACTGSFTNCVSFDNKYNYYLPPFTMKKWSNILGFSGGSGDKLPSGYTASTPSSSKQSSIRNTVNSTAKSIVDKCNKNIIPGEVYFNIYS